MTTSFLLRIASVVSGLLAAGHTLGGRKAWSPQGENQVLEAMRTLRFEVFGVNRTYMDFYLGFGFTISVFLVLQAVLLWQLAAAAKTNALQVRGMVAAMALAELGCTLVAWKFLFVLPTAFSAVLTLLLGLAFVVAR